MKHNQAVKWCAAAASAALLILCGCPPRTQRVESAAPQPLDRTASTEPAAEEPKEGVADASGSRTSPKPLNGKSDTPAEASRAPASHASGGDNSQGRDDSSGDAVKHAEPPPPSDSNPPRSAVEEKVSSSGETNRNGKGGAPASGAEGESNAARLNPSAPGPESSTTVSTQNPPGARSAAPDASTADARHPKASSPLSFSPQKNPTTAAGRGQPSLLDPMRPCVFMSLDGREGALLAGKMQWVLDKPVSSTPSLVLRTVPEVLGDVVRVRLMLIRLVEDPKAHGYCADSKWLYMIESKSDGDIEACAEIWLCASPLLTYTDKGAGAAGSTSAVVDHLPPLPAGVYELVGEIVGSTSEERTLTVTQFTVSAP